MPIFLFDRQIIETLLRSREDMIVVIDGTYIRRRQRSQNAKSKWSRSTPRLPGPIIDGSRRPATRCKLIGTKINPELATHEFVGIACFSARGHEILKQVYHDCAKKYDRGGAFRKRASFEQAAFTDLLQEVIDRGFTVHALEVNQGWVEMQTLADYGMLWRWLTDA